MSYFDNLFNPKFMFDNEYEQRRDIENLRLQVDNAPSLAPALHAQSERVDRLELLCKALVELVVSKGVGSEAELSVIMQQIDLARAPARARSRVQKAPFGTFSAPC